MRLNKRKNGELCHVVFARSKGDGFSLGQKEEWDHSDIQIVRENPNKTADNNDWCNRNPKSHSRNDSKEAWGAYIGIEEKSRKVVWRCERIF